MSNENEYIAKLQKMIDFEVEDTNSIQSSHHKSEHIAELEINTFFKILSFIEEMYNNQRESIINSRRGLFSSLTIGDMNNIRILDSQIAKVKTEKENLESFFKEAKDNRTRMYELNMKAHKRNIDYLQGQINDALNSTKKTNPEPEVKKSSSIVRYTFNDALNDLNESLSNCNDEETRKEIEETKLSLIKKHTSVLKNLVENGYVMSN